jgi:elongation factor Ts
VAISAKMVKELREKTGVGMMECKKALTECDGNVDQAIKFLRERGMAKAEKRSGRSTSEGLIHAYIHPGSKIGALVEVNCETDFVARTDDFQDLVKDLAMQVAASSPEYVSREQVPQEKIEAEKDIFRNQAKESGKPEHVIEKIVEGKINDFFSGICLLEQPFIKESKKTIDERVKETIARTGENITVKRFALFRLGEE